MSFIVLIYNDNKIVSVVIVTEAPKIKLNYSETTVLK